MEAKKAVKAIFAAIIDGLQDGGKAETPLGVFAVVPGPGARKLFRLGRWRRVYTKPKRVAFRPSRELLAACHRSISVPKEIPVPVSDANTKTNQQLCEKCGSSHFEEAEFRQYRQQYSASPGGDISPHTESPIRALVCVCGQPILPGRLRSCAPGDYTSFQKSFEVARQYRESTSPEAILGAIAELFARKPQHDELAERITKLQEI